MARFNFMLFMQAVQSQAGERTPPAGDAIWRAAPRLLRREGADFLRHAYHYFYGRDVDPLGIMAYQELARTRKGRLRALCSMYLAPEAKNTPLWLRKTWDIIRNARKSAARAGQRR